MTQLEAEPPVPPDFAERERQPEPEGQEREDPGDHDHSIIMHNSLLCAGMIMTSK